MKENMLKTDGLTYEYNIDAPAHGRYKNGRVVFEFDGSRTALLRRVHFYIDGQHFYAPMIVNKTVNFCSSWVLQRDVSLSRLKDEEFDVIATLSLDVAKSHEMQKTMRAILETFPVQTELFKKYYSVKAKEEKQAIREQIKSKNSILYILEWTRSAADRKKEAVRVAQENYLQARRAEKEKNDKGCEIV